MAPVDNLDFWKNRIIQAKGNGQLRYSVYLTQEEDWKHIEKTHREVIHRLIPSDAKVLDAGCGYGRGFEMLKPREYVGVDFSPDFIAQARQMYPGDFRVEDLKKLPFKKHQFDWAVCISIKHMIVAQSSQENWDQMEKELRRVAKKVLILEYSSPEEYEIL